MAHYPLVVIEKVDTSEDSPARPGPSNIDQKSPPPFSLKARSSLMGRTVPCPCSHSKRDQRAPSPHEGFPGGRREKAFRTAALFQRPHKAWVCIIKDAPKHNAVLSRQELAEIPKLVIGISAKVREQRSGEPPSKG